MADCSGDRVAPTTLLNHNHDSSMPGVERRGVCACVCACVCVCVCVCVCARPWAVWSEGVVDPTLI